MPRESLRNRRERAASVVQMLKRAYPDARCSLDYETVHQLLVATILSAQCTDERVNKVTPSLFRKYGTIHDFADGDLEELQQAVYATGFYVNKAKAIKQSAREIIERHDGSVPRTLAELTRLTGVGRKTASVILGAGYGIAEGIVVDTHVARISRLLRLSSSENPLKIERDLMKIVATRDWIVFSHLLIFHGRAICVARKPKCGDCVIAGLCPSASKI